jgi:hypothetical protein
MEGALSTEEAAAFLGVSIHGLNWWHYMGRGPIYLKLGKKRLYPLKYLEEFKIARVKRVLPNGKRKKVA